MNMEKSLFLAALVGSCVAIGNSQPIGDPDTPDNLDAETLVPAKRPKLNHPVHIPPCGLNQYFDVEEGRCLGVPGGGRLDHVDSNQFCETNTLKPHCSNPQYYYVCKSDKTILAKCPDGQHFENRLQRCVYVHPDTLNSYKIEPVEESYDHQLSLPTCTKLGRFPVPDNCATFYTCESNGHRLHRSVFRCPEGMGFHAESGTCNPTVDCVNKDSVKKICAPLAPENTISRNQIKIDENPENSDLSSVPVETLEKNLKEIEQDNLSLDPNIENRLQEKPIISESSKDIEESSNIQNTGATGELSEQPGSINSKVPEEPPGIETIGRTRELSEHPEIINNPAEDLEQENSETGGTEELSEHPEIVNNPVENLEHENLKIDGTGELSEHPEIVNNPAENLEHENSETGGAEELSELPEIVNNPVENLEHENLKIGGTGELLEHPETVNNPAENVEHENPEIENKEVASTSNLQPAENIAETHNEEEIEGKDVDGKSESSNSETPAGSSNLLGEKSSPINEGTGESLNKTPLAKISQTSAEMDLKNAESVESIPENASIPENIEVSADDSKNSEKKA